MITKLLPENVTDNWELIRGAIQGALPPYALDSPDKMNSILESILLGQLEVWVYYEAADELKIKSIWTTSIVTDGESKTKNLLIYSIFNFNHAEPENWIEGLKTMGDYAKANECAAITGFTVDPFIIRFVDSIGGDTKTHFIRIPV